MQLHGGGLANHPADERPPWCYLTPTGLGSGRFDRPRSVFVPR